MQLEDLCLTEEQQIGNNYINEKNLRIVFDSLLKTLEKQKERSINSEIKQIPHKITKKIVNELGKIVYEEFQKSDVLRRKFEDNFDNFFNELLYWSYGLEFTIQTKHRRGFDFLERIGTEEKFIGKVDLFCLIGDLIGRYSEKCKIYEKFSLEKEIKHDEKEIVLKAEFNTSFWENIFNDYDNYQGLDNEPICLFNSTTFASKKLKHNKERKKPKHAIASYLHSAHPNIHYLNVKAEGYNNPLATAIVMESQGRNNLEKKYQPYLIVEGVIENLGEIDDSKETKDNIFNFTWEGIEKFAKQRGISRIFINTSHSGNQSEPEEFVNFVYKKYLHQLTEENFLHGEVLIGKIVNFFKEKEDNYIPRKKFLLLEQPKKVLCEKKGVWFTHEILVPHFRYDVYAINSKYNGEEYADWVYLWYKEEAKNSDKHPFLLLEGCAQGFEINLERFGIKTLFHGEDTNIADVYSKIAELAMKEQDETKAKEYSKKAIQYCEENKLYSKAAKILENLEDKVNAMFYYEKAGDYYKAAEVALKLGNNEKAIDYYERKENYFGVVELLLKLGERERAKKIAEQKIEECELKEDYLLAKKFALMMGYSEVVARINQVIIPKYRLEAQRCEREGEYFEAAEKYAQIGDEKKMYGCYKKIAKNKEELWSLRSAQLFISLLKIYSVYDNISKDLSFKWNYICEGVNEIINIWQGKK